MMRRVRANVISALWIVSALANFPPVVSRTVEASDVMPATFRAGAIAMDITPTAFPVIVNGMFEERLADRAYDPLFARCLVLDDGSTRLAIAVVDNLMMPRELLDAVKRAAAKATGVSPERMLISATHTHSAPSVMGCLGSRCDPLYPDFLSGRLVRGLEMAAKALRPARVGWAVGNLPLHTNCRRWIFRSDRIGVDPFGERTMRAHMHPGYQNPNTVGPAGPIDPGLTVLAFQTPEGKPIAVLANYSMHYFGSVPLSADYFGRFCDLLTKRIASDSSDPNCVVMMSQGTSGDLHWMDYSQPQKAIDIDAYATAVATGAHDVYERITYRDHVSIAMSQTALTLQRRTPDASRLAWARPIAKGIAGRVPKGLPEIYALEALALADEPKRELLLQAIRVGELGITGIPNEVFGITGLKLKAQSPLSPTMNIELANGAEGYIPPPEQHSLGGYTTWPARTAGLEVQAEPRIVETLLSLLESVSGKQRRRIDSPTGKYAKGILAAKPVAYWQLDELSGTRALDAAGNRHHGTYESGVALHLDGCPEPGLGVGDRNSRAVHFAGGRLVAEIPNLGNSFAISFWFWNGLSNEVRPITAWLASHATGEPAADGGVHLGIGGIENATSQGRLVLAVHAAENKIAGVTPIKPKTWHHVAFVQDGRSVSVYLDGKPELAHVVNNSQSTRGSRRLFFAGRSDGRDGLEGKLDDIAVFGRELESDEIEAQFRSASD